MKNKIYITLILSLLIVYGVSGQSYGAFVKQFATAYDQTETLLMEMSIKQYKDASFSHLIHAEQASIVKQKGDLFYARGDLELLQTDRSTVMLLKSEKMLMYGELPDSFERPAAEADFMGTFDWASIDSLDIKLQGEQGNALIYVMDTPNRVVLRTEVRMNKTTGRPAKVIYYSNPNFSGSSAVTVVQFHKISTEPSIPKSQFDLRKYVLKKDNKIELAAAYADFELIINNTYSEFK